MVSYFASCLAAPLALDLDMEEDRSPCLACVGTRVLLYMRLHMHWASIMSSAVLIVTSMSESIGTIYQKVITYHNQLFGSSDTSISICNIYY